MYAAQCYQACLDGVYATIQKEEDIKVILSKNIKGDKQIMDIIVSKINIWESDKKNQKFPKK